MGKHEPGYETMTNNELVQSVLEVPETEAGLNISPEAEDKEEPVQPSYKVSCKEALTAVETLLHVMKIQDATDYVLLQIHG